MAEQVGTKENYEFSKKQRDEFYKMELDRVEIPNYKTTKIAPGHKNGRPDFAKGLIFMESYLTGLGEIFDLVQLGRQGVINTKADHYLRHHLYQYTKEQRDDMYHSLRYQDLESYKNFNKCAVASVLKSAEDFKEKGFDLKKLTGTELVNLYDLRSALDKAIGPKEILDNYENLKSRKSRLIKKLDGLNEERLYSKDLKNNPEKANALDMEIKRLQISIIQYMMLCLYLKIQFQLLRNTVHLIKLLITQNKL